MSLFIVYAGENTAYVPSGNDSQGDPTELEFDDSEGGDSESESHTESIEAMNENSEDDNMGIEKREERNDPPETSVQVSPARSDTDKASLGNSDGNEAMAIEPNTSGLQQNNLIGDSVSFPPLLWTRTHQK